MATVNVQSNGNAPPGLKTGDVVSTGGGNYTVVAPGTAGSSYNPASGYWSVKTDSTAGKLQGAISGAQSIADRNNANALTSAQYANLFSAISAERQYRFNAQEAQKQRDWQERMSNTAYQRQIADLKAAGLNPVLGYMQGQGATTPSGAAASGANYHGAQAQVDMSANDVLQSLFSSLINSATQKDIAQINASTALQQAAISSAAAVSAAGIGASASRYHSDVNRQTQLETQNWQNILANRLLGSGKAKSHLDKFIDFAADGLQSAFGEKARNVANSRAWKK
uniref:DNA pilot protein n=1 Tax=Dulem virus 144 TaxID=3145621 RepID=A0AAU8B199_9VIRU